MNTVELFCGIGGFRQAADAQGFVTLWANDNCPKACKVYQDNFGNQELKSGDIRELWQNIPQHNLLTAGFPCQPFSSAGKKKGLRDPRGNLFEIILKIFQKYRPQYFILENVKRLLSMESGSHFATIIAKLAELNYLVEWRLLNATEFGLPQNRQRIFLLGKLINNLDLSSNQSLQFSLISPENLAYFKGEEYEKLNLPCQWLKIEAHGKEFPNWGLALGERFFAKNIKLFSDARKLVTLKSILQDQVDERFDFTESTIERLNSSLKVNRFVDGVQIIYNQAGGSRMGYTIFGIDGVAPTLTSTTSRHYERYKIKDRYRRLTNIEYARLQGFPDHHCDAVSLYDQYSLYGNAVPPIMVEWVMKKITELNPHQKIKNRSRSPQPPLLRGQLHCKTEFNLKGGSELFTKLTCSRL